MSNSLPQDLQGLRVIFRGEDQGVVTRDLREERVKVQFDDGTEEYVPRTDLEVIEDE